MASPLQKTQFHTRLGSTGCNWKLTASAGTGGRAAPKLYHYRIPAELVAAGSGFYHF